MKNLFLLVIFVVNVLALSANEPRNPNPESTTTYQIEGKITDHLTGEALAGVCLKLKGNDKVTYSDLNGNFIIEGVTPGTYDIDVDYVSYKDITLKGVSTKATDLKLKVELESVANSLMN